MQFHADVYSLIVECVVHRFRESASSAFDTSALQEKLSSIRGSFHAFLLFSEVFSLHYAVNVQLYLCT